MLSKFKSLFIISLVLTISTAFSSEIMAKDYCGPKGKKIVSFFGREHWHFNKNRQVAIKRKKKGKSVPAWRACKKHDECYERLGSKRKQCDKLYLETMYGLCERHLVNYSEKANKKCKKQAKRNYEFIRKNGGKQFKKMQAEAKKKANPKNATKKK